MKLSKLDWEEFVQRVERLRGPAAVPTPLARPGSAEILVLETEIVVAEEAPAIEVGVVNLGGQRAALSAQVMDANGKKIGKGLKRKPQPATLAPGERSEVKIGFHPAQWKALLDGGRVVMRPGSLPESYRSVVLRTHPLLPAETMRWDLPVPPTARFDYAPADGAPETAFGVALEVQRVDGRPWCKLGVDPLPGGPRGRATLGLIVPPEPLKFRFTSGDMVLRNRQTLVQSADGQWSIFEGDFGYRSYTVENRSEEPLAGHLWIEPPGLLTVEPRYLDLKPGEQRDLTLALNVPGGLQASTGSETVAVRFAPGTAGGEEDPASVVEFLRIELVPKKAEEPVLRWRGESPAHIPVERSDAGWTLSLPIENVGTGIARPFLRSHDGPERSREVEVMPATEPQEISFTFELSAEDGEGRRLGKRRMHLVSHEPIIWDPRLREAITVDFSGPGGPSAQPESAGVFPSLEWEIEGDLPAALEVRLLCRNDSGRSWYMRRALVRINRWRVVDEPIRRDLREDECRTVWRVGPPPLSFWRRQCELRVRVEFEDRRRNRYMRSASVTLHWRGRSTRPEVSYE